MSTARVTDSGDGTRCRLYNHPGSASNPEYDQPPAVEFATEMTADWALAPENAGMGTRTAAMGRTRRTCRTRPEDMNRMLAA
jgi:hypothetical protein